MPRYFLYDPDEQHFPGIEAVPAYRLSALQRATQTFVDTVREIAITSLAYCEEKYGHDDQARLNVEAACKLMDVALRSESSTDPVQRAADIATELVALSRHLRSELADARLSDDSAGRSSRSAASSDGQSSDSEDRTPAQRCPAAGRP